MKRFRFRLEKILRYKNQIEERKKQNLSKQNRQLRIDRAELNELIDQNRAYRGKYFALFKGKMNILGLKLSHSYLDKLYRDITRQKDVVAKSEEKANQAKKQLQTAMRDRKRYDKLKERRKAEHDYESGREEQKALDEIASGSKAGFTATDIAP